MSFLHRLFPAGHFVISVLFLLAGFALIGAGHLVGISVGMAMLAGLVTGWWVLLPILTAGIEGPADEVALGVFGSEVRFFGAGVIGVAAVWTLLRIIGPILAGIRSAMAASRLRAAGGEGLPLIERDMPIKVVAGVIFASLLPIAVLLWLFVAGGPLESGAPSLIAGVISQGAAMDGLAAVLNKSETNEEEVVRAITSGELTHVPGMAGLPDASSWKTRLVAPLPE